MDGWVIGFAIGGAVVLVVVILLVTLILLARKIGGKAEDILEALQSARENTTGLGALTQTNETADRIVAGATTARETIERGV